MPDAVGDKGVSLASHYAEVRRYFWLSIAFTYLMCIAYGVTILGPRVLLGHYLSPLLQLVTMAVLIAVADRRVHAVLVPVVFLRFCYNHLFHPMFSDLAWVAGPLALP